VLARRRVLIITGLAPRRGHRRDDFGLTLGLRVRRVDLLMRREPTIDQPLRWRAAGPFDHLLGHRRHLRRVAACIAHVLANDDLILAGGGQLHVEPA
jgi:hypothetical protein